MGKHKPVASNKAGSTGSHFYRRKFKKPQQPAQANNGTDADDQPSEGTPADSFTESDAPMVDVQSSEKNVFTDMPSFDKLKGKIDDRVLTTITNDLKFERMSPIQAAAIEPLLQGQDVLGQARTGTGKTLAFLVPAIENLLRSQNPRVAALIISPTRELVLQIAAEAGKLLSRLPDVRVRTAIGGTNKDSEGRKMYNGCHILVATPGRLLDHLQDEQMQYLLSAVNTLVLDEADRMLDMGFLPDIKKIISYLPSPTQVQRQAMLFSATVPDSIVTITKTILKPGYQSISTIPEGESNTHKRVNQYLITVPTVNELAPSLVSVVTSELSSASPTSSEFKAIVFAPTAVLSDLYTHILEFTLQKTQVKVMTMHARMSQPKRIAATNEFRTAKNAICVATDVIARGMDFPHVTHVIQIGLPMNRESYIHRLGRTARADASGVGILILSESEKTFLRELRDVTFLDYPHTVAVDDDRAARALETLDEDKKGKIYQGWLGYYKAMTKYTKWSSVALVEQGNKFAIEGLGCAEVPELEASVVGKMGLRGTTGLKVVPNKPRVGRGGGSGRGGGGGGGRGGANNGAGGKRKFGAGAS